jgi:hypothetical protein
MIQEILSEGLCILRNSITYNKSRILSPFQGFREKIEGHFRTHATKANESDAFLSGEVLFQRFQAAKA